MSKRQNSRKEKAQALNVFLLLRPVRNIIEEIQRTKPQLKMRHVNIEGREGGTLFAANFPKKEPSWLKFFSNRLDRELEIYNQGSGAMLLLQVNGHPFAISFGYGKSILPDECWVEDFGLIVTLNNIDPEKVRQVDHFSLTAISRHTKTQSGQAVPLHELGVDFDQDLIKEIVGSPTIEGFGQRISGTEQVKLTPKTSIDKLPMILDRLYVAYQDKTYLKLHPWVNRFKEVTSNSEKTRLDSTLLSRLQNSELERTWMAVPDVVDWDVISWFSYRGEESDDHFADIYIDKFLDTIRDKSVLTIEYLKHRKILALDHQENVYKDWTAYKCLYCEVDGDKSVYILTGGKWYKIENDFAASVNKFMEEVEYEDLKFPRYIDSSEGEYNQRVCRENTMLYALMDARNIRLSGYDPIEFCDIYSRDKKIIHVKHYRGSDGLSHLFMQGSTSATLFLSIQEFREKINQLLPPTHILLDTLNKPIASDYTIIYAVISKDASSKLQLPFFSRITFRKVHRELTNYGFKVKLAKIINANARVT